MVVLFAQQFLQDQKRLTINNTEAQKPMNSANAYEFLANSQNHNNTVKESNNKASRICLFYYRSRIDSRINSRINSRVS